MNSASSLRLRLLIGVLTSVALVWLAIGTLGYFEARHELDELLDAHLAQSASILLAQLADENEEGEEIELEHLPQSHRYERRVAFQVWDDGPHLRLRSATAPSTRLSPVDDGFSTYATGAQRWRVFSLRGPTRDLLIQVGERIEAREEVSAEIAEHLLIPMGVALPLLGFLLVLAIGHALKPLNAIARNVGNQNVSRLEPIQLGAVPAEVLPIISQLNALFARIQSNLENERRFTADAAHELRTPIAAIRVQAQVAKVASEHEIRMHALDRVLDGCDRATRLTEQLLILARLDAGNRTGTNEQCDLVAIARDVLAELGPSAYQKGVLLELDAVAPALLSGNEGLISVMLRNLIDNSIRYCPSGTQVSVRITKSGNGIQLEVIDQGPGIPVTERESVLQRFYRISGNDASGSGLGLSIVARIATQCDADLVLADVHEGRGLKVVLTFPASK